MIASFTNQVLAQIELFNAPAGKYHGTSTLQSSSTRKGWRR